jgi:hypothetical protein
MARSIFPAKFKESSTTRFLTGAPDTKRLHLLQLQSAKRFSAIGRVIHFNHRSCAHSAKYMPAMA